MAVPPESNYCIKRHCWKGRKQRLDLLRHFIITVRFAQWSKIRNRSGISSKKILSMPCRSLHHGIPVPLAWHQPAWFKSFHCLHSSMESSCGRICLFRSGFISCLSVPTDKTCMQQGAPKMKSGETKSASENGRLYTSKLCSLTEAHSQNEFCYVLPNGSPSTPRNGI